MLFSTEFAFWAYVDRSKREKDYASVATKGSVDWDCNHKCKANAFQL